MANALEASVTCTAEMLQICYTRIILRLLHARPWSSVFRFTLKHVLGREPDRGREDPRLLEHSLTSFFLTYLVVCFNVLQELTQLGNRGIRVIYDRRCLLSFCANTTLSEYR